MTRSVRHFFKALPANLRKLFTPISFLRLRSPDLILYQWVLPTLGAVTLYIFILNPIGWGLDFEVESLMRDINSLVGVLVGFYIAALAAVATFPNPSLDEPLQGASTTLKRRTSGGVVVEPVSRRRYLATVFGYCAMVSVIIYIFGVMQTNINVSFAGNVWLEGANEFLFKLLWFIYIWFILSLLTTTLVGLHYLVDRMHR